MDMIRKNLINDIINNSIDIMCCNINEDTDNKCYIKFLHNTNKVISGAIKKHKYSFLREYNDMYILRDEVYASYYECILKTIDYKDYTNSELLIISNDIKKETKEITREFCKMVSSCMNNNIRSNLIDPTRRDQKNHSYKLLDTKTLYFGSSIELENLLDDINNDKSLSNEFNEWLIDNKDQVLTKGQLKYFNNELLENNKQKQGKIHYKIRESLKKNESAPQDKVEAKNKQTINKIKVVKNLLEIYDKKEFIKQIKSVCDKVYISDTIIDNVSKKERINFNKNMATDKTIKEYRVALFKLLDKLNRLL